MDFYPLIIDNLPHSLVDRHGFYTGNFQGFKHNGVLQQHQVIFLFQLNIPVAFRFDFDHTTK